jgi:hypothetical protein
MRTQALLARTWQSNGLFPHCTDTGAGRPGRDLLNTPGLFVEVKARGLVSLPATLTKAEQDKEAGELAIVVWRHNGQGEKSIGRWTVTMRLSDFQELWVYRELMRRAGTSGEFDNRVRTPASGARNANGGESSVKQRGGGNARNGSASGVRRPR